mmetsp:Transcript_27583/g.88699  ORF Transcript_27583/g.88699 Transcript_27583/m.88699 type:complete len:238 (-) Transcript_27583:519-1232(-)
MSATSRPRVMYVRAYSARRTTSCCSFICAAILSSRSERVPRDAPTLCSCCRRSKPALARRRSSTASSYRLIMSCSAFSSMCLNLSTSCTRASMMSGSNERTSVQDRSASSMQWRTGLVSAMQALGNSTCVLSPQATSAPVRAAMASLSSSVASLVAYICWISFLHALRAALVGRSKISICRFKSANSRSGWPLISAFSTVCLHQRSPSLTSVSSTARFFTSSHSRSSFTERKCWTSL